MRRLDILTSKKLGFTLGEALITIGIIGVISALTIPALMKSTNDAETVAKVKKAYNTLANAYDQASYENNNLPAGQWVFATGENLLDVMADQMKVARTCNGDQGCFATAAEYGGGVSTFMTNSSGHQYLTSDGMAFRSDGTTIMVDVNGPKRPNQPNIDAFYFVVDATSNSILPAGLNVAPSSLGSSAEATAWVIYNDNLDYNKSCKSSLSWSGNKSCREVEKNSSTTK